MIGGGSGGMSKLPSSVTTSTASFNITIHASIFALTCSLKLVTGKVILPISISTILRLASAVRRARKRLEGMSELLASRTSPMDVSMSAVSSCIEKICYCDCRTK